MRPAARTCVPAVFLFLLLASGPAIPAQQVEPSPPTQAEQLARCLAAWRDAFRSGYLRPQATIRARADAMVYGETIEPGGVLENAPGRLSNVAALRDLLDLARRTGGVASARAVLGIAAVSHARRLTDPEAYEVRELGHWTLMRSMHDDEVRQMLLRVAQGQEAVEVNSREETEGVDDERQVVARIAALAALGLRRDAETRVVIEALLAEPDERIRLAAAEALGQMRTRDSADVVARAVRTESHPVVAQALVIALDRILASHRDDPPQQVRDRLVRTALRTLGANGWRTDLALVELAERNPALQSIPAMIRVLEGWGSDDPLIEAVNANASPFLKRRAWRTLRRLTGTLLPQDDPAAWWAFWEAERDNIVLPSDPVRADALVTTHTGFFGIPITGREIAIVIDTSGSMKEGLEVQDARGRPERISRLDAAKRELLKAVHAMPSESRYHLLTFSSDVMIWNERPVPPNDQSYEALTECVGRFQAVGGTNLFAALMQVLAPGNGIKPTTGEFDYDEMFVLTDGQPSTGQVRDPDGILTIVEEVNQYRRVRIHTVHVGGEEGADLMRRLAEANEGVFVKR